MNEGSTRLGWGEKSAGLNEDAVFTKTAKRWSAVSDGGEDQGAEEVTVHGAEEESEEASRQFWKRAVSRERLFLSARPGPSRPSTWYSV